MALSAMQPRSGDRLLLNYGTDQGASYSRDGTKIAFMNNYDGDYEICVMNADGTGIKQLTRNSATDTYPSWSPDGTKIAFASNRDGDLDIYRYDISGHAPLQWDLAQAPKIVSDDNAVEGPAIWSPDGKQIALSSNRDGDFEVYVMNADGGPQRQLTHNTVDDVVLDWQSLHDLRAPTVKALTSRGTPGKAITLRFKASDDSGRASVGITVFLGKRPVGYIH